MIVVGITGGFASGKSLILKEFKNKGAHAIDADKIVHLLYDKNAKIKRNVIKAFGTKVLRGKKIDRRKVSKEAFSSKRNINKLCKIVHPETIKLIKKEIKKHKKNIIVLEAPLLVEAGLLKLVDFLIVVNAPLSNKISNSHKKGFDSKDIILRESMLMPIKTKLKYADFIISNNATRTKLKKGVKEIWQKLKRR